MALDVTDGQTDTAVAQREGVVPVAAHVEALARGRVPHGQMQPPGDGQIPREHVALQREGQLDAGTLHLGLRSRLGRQIPKPGEQLVAVVRGAGAGH
ncbi:hypothetical protein SPURM210S_07374 [Streptomyces purpurascens]